MNRRESSILILAMALTMAAGCASTDRHVEGQLTEREARGLACELIVDAYRQEGVTVTWEVEQFTSVDRDGARWRLVGLSQRSHPVVSFALDGSAPSVEIIWWRR